MQDPYKVLNVPLTASQADIKKAFKALALQHHPDKGGSLETFQEISEAYQTLTNPSPKKDTDGPFSTSGPVADILNEFFRRAHYSSRIVNQNIRVVMPLTIRETIFGCEKTATIRYSTGHKDLKLKFPPGIKAGDTLTFANFGDDTNSGIPPGHLFVAVRIIEDENFRIVNGQLHADIGISAWQAMLGATIDLDAIDGQKLSVVVKPNTQQTDQIMVVGEGLFNMATKKRESLTVNIHIFMPELNTKQKQTIKKWL